MLDRSDSPSSLGEDLAPEASTFSVLKKEGSTEQVQRQPDLEASKYTPEARQEQISKQAALIRRWANEQGLQEGRDYMIVEKIKDIVGKDGKALPHEEKAFYVGVQEKHYRQFHNYCLSRYAEEMRTLDPKGKVRLDYSWGGRFLAGWAGVPCDTVPLLDVKKRIISTHHQEFKKFFKTKTGFDFPSAKTLNAILKKMSDRGLDIYRLTLTKLQELKKQPSLSAEKHRLVSKLIDELERAIGILNQAKTGAAVAELPEQITGIMPASQRFYSDLTYNAEDLANLDDVEELTGFKIPKEARIDKIFDQFNFDQNRMEEICKDFSAYLAEKQKI